MGYWHKTAARNLSPVNIGSRVRLKTEHVTIRLAIKSIIHRFDADPDPGKMFRHHITVELATPDVEPYAPVHRILSTYPPTIYLEGNDEIEIERKWK